MPKFLNQKGIIPIILIIILLVIIAGVAGIVYKSRKEIKVGSNKTTEATKSAKTNDTTKTIKTNDSSASTSENAAVELANSGKLADKPIELKADNRIISSPKFSIIPPAGWEKLPPDGDIQVEFLSPSKDQIKEGLAYLNVQPNIVVFVVKENFKDLDEAIAVLEKRDVNSDYQKNNLKTLINGEEAYVIEKTVDLAPSLRQGVEAQVKQTIAQSGTEIAEEKLNQDMEKVLQQATGKLLSYSFYKNGYYINVLGQALESYWDKRGSQLKQSLDTFKFLPK